MPGRCQDKVVIVTGAGGGLGRAYARFLADNGAFVVVVNDVGGARDGSGSGTGMADSVVDEIRSAGGQAVADYSSVATREGAEAIVETAIEHFGAVTGVVDDAGILRDGAFHKMTDDNWDRVSKENSRACSHTTATARGGVAALAAGGRQNFGRIVVATSTTGSTATSARPITVRSSKAGLIGLINTLAIEGAGPGSPPMRWHHWPPHG